MTKYKTDIRDAKSIEDMQSIARNQIRFFVWFLEEQIEHLNQIDPTQIRDWESYEKQIEGIEFEDLSALDALKELGEYYETMIAGNYF